MRIVDHKTALTKRTMIDQPVPSRKHPRSNITAGQQKLVAKYSSALSEVYYIK